MATKRVPPVEIEENATIAALVDGLDKPVDYVGRVLERLERCKRAFGNAQVRIAVLSRAECPNYLIEYVREDPKTLQRDTLQDAAYSGSTHRELGSHHLDAPGMWSLDEMNIESVSELMGRLRSPRTPSRSGKRN